MKVLAHLTFWGPGSDNVGLALEGTLSSRMSVGTLGGSTSSSLVLFIVFVLGFCNCRCLGGCGVLR